MKPYNHQIKILYLNDSDACEDQVISMLKKTNSTSDIKIINTKTDYKKALINFEPEIIIFDNNLASFNSIEALNILKQSGLNIPFILIINAEEEESAITMLEKGVSDYLIKDRLQRLPSAIINAFEKNDLQKKEQKIKENEIRYHSFFENSMDGLLLTITDGSILAANPAACAMFQMTEEEICKSGRFGLVDLTDERLIPLIEERQRKGKAKGEITLIRKDGSKFQGEITSTVFKDINGEDRTSMIIRDVSETKQVKDKLISTSEALQQAVSDLNKTMDSSLDIICSFNEDGKFMDASAASEIILGYKPKELIGKSYLDFVFHEDEQNTANTFLKIKSGINVTMFENNYIHKDGSIIPLLWSAKWDNKDKLLYCVAKDAREKKKLEKSFEIERQRFNDLYLQAPSSMGVLKGPTHVYEMANTLYLQLIGKKDIIGKTVKEVLPEAESQGFLDILDTVYKTGNTFSANEMLVKLDKEGSGKLVDTYLNFIYQVHRNTDGEIGGIFFFVNDVTEQVLSRKKIEESEKNYWNLIQNLPAAVCTCDTEGNILLYNKAAVKLWGREPKIGTDKWFEGIKKYDKDNIIIPYHSIPLEQSVKEGRLIYGEEIIIEGSDGVRRNVISHPSPTFDSAGNLTGAVNMLIDITERKQAELERTKITNDLIQRSKTLEQFTYIVSHNLRAPIANILGLSNVLKGSLSDTDRTKIQNFLFTAVDNLDKIVIDLNRILQVKTEITENKEVVCFPELVNGIESSIQNLIEKEHVKIVTDFTDIDKTTIIKSYIYSVFYNLIINSIKYRHPDKNLTITIKSEIIKGKIKITFKDNGSGIDLKQHGDKIFGLYKRFHPNIEGKGMGLFMTKTQMEVLGGSISVKSKPNVETKFIIELPL